MAISKSVLRSDDDDVQHKQSILNGNPYNNAFQHGVINSTQQCNSYSSSPVLNRSMGRDGLYNGGDKSQILQLSSNLSNISPGCNPHKRLSCWRKLCFAASGPPYQLPQTAIGFYFSLFLLEAAQIKPVHASLIIFFGRIWDGITDPIIGYLITKTQSRCASLRYWILFNSPILIVSYIMLWFVPQFSEMAKVVYYLAMYLIFQTSLTCLNVPSCSLTMYLSASRKERDAATAYKMTAEIGSVVLSCIIQGAVTSIISLDRKDHCSKDIVNSTLGNIVESEELTEELVQSWRLAYIVAAFIIGGLSFICILVLFFGVNEHAPIGNKQDNSCGFVSDFSQIIMFKPFYVLTLSYLFLALALMFMQNNLAFYFIYVLDLKESYRYLLVALLLSALFAMPFWQAMINRVGKRYSMQLGFVFFAPTLLAMMVTPKSVPIAAVYGFSIISGVGLANAYLLPWSMLPDVIVEFRIQKDRSFQKEGLFYGVYVLFTKFAVGISLGISNLCLQLAGYSNKACNQPELVSVTLRMLIAPAPLLMLFISFVFLFAYPITEDDRLSNEKSGTGLIDISTIENGKETDKGSLS